ncbi:eCIS core domain-containing protein [Aquipseudomonas alcaligenes]|uniref:eCIS core domain-containing protein n=1 Tax=Aquipseudomonas alcaligenes TaxID=43263 RepID=A0AA37FMY6_AQUAC|nr:DUF4157 domain-containing protein [Pseudomonas alcaligenes]BCR24619.1 hypothetical protein KAM426_21460 [Pseudomonas alcaligenes]GIZ68042.1 hypothetical protein KAM428_31270 [Pseudomonas alcaligenes]GIZ72516.1 hypothetical protein KAM429_32770 [Pseudomonas alcaligenes]GIZ76867.1 hypothetical protein KAM430_32760 [Pseudomonas alcaligenes]GIZ85486.1 hypothetical protein KAM434_31810 [Pseudomonas alcaligenes]
MKTTTTPSAQPAASHLLLQRKCACGGSAGMDSECESCRKKKALGIQKRLSIGASHDPLEQEADRAAAQVLHMGHAAPLPGSHGPLLSRLASTTAEAGPAPTSVASVLNTPGTALPASSRAFFEPRFGHDFSRVRIHHDEQASASARDVSAHAYTVGSHVVFAQGRFAPETSSGRELLAHELAHVVQQSSAGQQRVLRQQAPATPASAQATAAEAACDLGTLCRLSRQAPEVVTQARMLSAWRACVPGVPVTSLVGGNPCLTPNFGSYSAPQAPGPRRSMTGPQPAPASAGGGSSSGSGGGLSLPSTTINFNLGPAAFTIDLPASLAIQLPVPFSGARLVVFSLNASTSEFSFTATINAVPHVRIIARAGVTTEGVGSAGLTVQTTRTTCQAVSPEAARSALTTAGNRLRDAILAVQNPPAPAADASALSQTFAPHMRYAEVVSAIVKLNSEIERVGAPCREVPVFSAQIGVTGPLTRPDTPPGPGVAPGPSLGGSLTFHF